MAGVLGVLSVSAVMVGYVATGRSFAWTYEGIDATETVVIWDKLLVLILSLGSIVIARTRPEWSRAMVSLVVIAVSLAIIADDIATGRMDFTAGYLMLVLLAAAGTLPYQPWQSLALGVSIASLYILAMSWAASQLDVVPLQVTRIVTLFVTTVIATGISAVLYVSRHKQYEALRHANVLRKKAKAHEAEIREMERIKSRFFANLSHEFRTPLTILLGPIEDALAGEYGPLDARFRKQLPAMQRSGRRLKHQIELLDLARMEARRIEPRPQPGNLTAFVGEVISRFATLGERKGVRIDCHSDPKAIITSFDASILDKIVDNLLSNALKFTPPGGRVRLTLTGSGDWVTIHVRDTGQGIPSEDLPHIFDRFYRVDASSAAYEQAGTGIGLALVKELVTLCGGDIHVESEQGFGSEFVVRLPLVWVDGTSPDRATEPLSAEAGQPQELRPPSATADGVSGLGKRHDPDSVEGHDASADERSASVPAEDAPLIFVVEDDDDLRSYVVAQFAETYRIAEAADGLAAFNRLNDLQPDLVISDVMMPGMNGIDLCRAIKSDGTLNHIPVVLLTARALQEDIMEGLGVGAGDYICKPFSAAELRMRAENLIEIRRCLRERYGNRVTLEPSSIAVTSAEAEFVEHVVAVIDQHIPDSNFGVDWLADELGMSARHLQRKLRKATRLSAAGLLRLMRMKRAAQLLDGGAGTVKDVAEAVGYRDPDYFARVFRQLYGVPPSQYDGTQTPVINRGERDIEP